jgi:hypothetical protein
MAAPDLRPDAGDPPPPDDDEGGDRRPDPDWRVVGMLSFMAGFCATAAARYGWMLFRVMK